VGIGILSQICKIFKWS